MLDTVFQILSVLGVILLVLLGIILVLFVLILFFPVAYRITGARDLSDTWLRIRITWLFGVFRLRYQLPEPGNITAKLLWFTLFDSGRDMPAGEKHAFGASGKKQQAKKASPQGQKPEAAQTEKEQVQKLQQEQQIQERSQTEAQQPQAEEQPVQEQQADEDSALKHPPEGENGQTQGQSSGTVFRGFFDRIRKKIQKIKYTICNIYDKIKQIRDNITYYTKLLSEESTRELFDYGKQHLGRILKSLRPRRIRADILFGTGSPDTTGYAMGIYGILSPYLGRKVYVTPDFTQAILQGSVDIAGHTAVFTLLWNGARLFLDRRLQVFIKKWKAGGKKDGR